MASWKYRASGREPLIQNQLLDRSVSLRHKEIRILQKRVWMPSAPSFVTLDCHVPWLLRARSTACRTATTSRRGRWQLVPNR